MKSIKRITYLFIVVVNLIFFTGCSEDFITKPLEYGTQSDVSFRKTVNGLLMTLNGAYGPLGGEYWIQYPTNWIILGEHRSDDNHAGGEGVNDDAQAHALNDFNIYSTNGVFTDYWKTCFLGIHFANQVIYSAPGALISNPGESVLINKYVAEAKCMRAYYYFDLVRQFGGLPLVLDASTVLRGRTDRLSIYDQIQKDLLDAADGLPTTKQLAASDLGRMTNGSALSILAKVYLFRASLEPAKATEYFTKAYQAAKQVIDSKQYELLPTYDAIWRNSGDFSSENIVEGGQPNPTEKTLPSSWFVIYQAPRYYYEVGTLDKIGTEFGWGFNCPTQDFVNAYEPGDPRKNWTVFSQGDSSKNGSKKNIMQAICFDHSTTGYYTRKTTADEFPYSGNNSLNIKFYRYADLLLVGAEAANEIGETTDALAWLEMVRARARNTGAAPNHASDIIPGSPVQIITMDQSALRDIIRHERRIELGMEGHRFYDLVRWDGTAGFNWKTTIETAQSIPGPNYQIDNDALSGVPRSGRTVLVEEKHKLSPIPSIEIKNSSNLLIQNPGY